MERICGECIHYQHGVLENPCSKNTRYVGYLKTGCFYWSEDDSEVDEDSVTKVCAKCGKELPLSMFYKDIKTSDKYSGLCKICKPYKGKKTKRREI